MQKQFMLLVGFASSLLVFLDTPKPPKEALDAIRPADIRQQIDFLAADAMMGRNTPSPELDRAADYIAKEFQHYGLRPVNGSYFNEFQVGTVRLGKENLLAISVSGSEQEYAIKKDFMPFDMTASTSVIASLAFAGYGITAPEYDYDDYADLGVKGKVVLVLRHEPGEKDAASPFDGEKDTEYAQVAWKVQNAIDHGATGVLIVTDPVNHRSLAPRGFPWPSLFEGIPDEALPLTLALTDKEKIPVLQVGELAVQNLFGSVDSLRTLQQQIDAAYKPKSFLLSNIQVRLRTTTETMMQTTRNVVGLVDGSDKKLKDEIVVIGAHYDHVGYLKKQAGADSIYNGADDNASGTCAVLAIARAFGAAKKKPKRSILIMAFAGEEKGLFGSRAYVEKPLLPLDKTVAMLNLDMVGRNAPDSVSVGGVKSSPDLIKINEEENREVGLMLDYSIDSFDNRSDQYNFARKKIPFLFYFTGLHKDYHQVSDHPDKIDEHKIAKIATLAFRVAWRAANTSERFEFVDPK